MGGKRNIYFLHTPHIHTIEIYNWSVLVLIGVLSACNWKSIYGSWYNLPDNEGWFEVPFGGGGVSEFDLVIGGYMKLDQGVRGLVYIHTVLVHVLIEGMSVGLEPSSYM